MILLNEPWSIIERKAEIERRHESARRACILAIYAIGMIALGLGLGVLLR